MNEIPYFAPKTLELMHCKMFSVFSCDKVVTHQVMAFNNQPALGRSSSDQYKERIADSHD